MQQLIADGAAPVSLLRVAPRRCPAARCGGSMLIEDDDELRGGQVLKCQLCSRSYPVLDVAHDRMKVEAMAAARRETLSHRGRPRKVAAGY